MNVSAQRQTIFRGAICCRIEISKTDLSSPRQPFYPSTRLLRLIWAAVKHRRRMVATTDGKTPYDSSCLSQYGPAKPILWMNRTAARSEMKYSY
jgi:hypothetical protein